MAKRPPVPESVKKITDTAHVQKAEVTLPLSAFQLIDAQEYKDAIEIIRLVRESAMAVLEVDEKNADVTAVEYQLVGEDAVVTVTQVNT